MVEPMRRGTVIALPQPAYRAVLTRLSSVQKTEIDWICPGRLAAGKLTILDGDPGLGKSTIALNWAARVSRGEPILNGRPRPPRGVILIADEDDLGDTVRPRLEVEGADLDRVLHLHKEDEEGNRTIPEFPADGQLLREAAREIDAGLIVIDPIVAYLGSDINSHRDADVRRALAPVIAVAQEQRAAVLVLRHLNKSSGGTAITRGGGSIAFSGVARVGMIVAKDPDDETGATCVLATYKTNIGTMPRSIAYQLQSVPGTDVARIDWLGESHHYADRLVQPPPTGEEVEQRSEAEAFLLDALAGGSLEVRDLQRMAKESAIGWRTVERAKAKLGVVQSREGFGRGSRSVWRLPATPKAPVDRHYSPFSANDETEENPGNIRDFTHPAIDRQQDRAREGIALCPSCGLPVGADGSCPNCLSMKRKG